MPANIEIKARCHDVLKQSRLAESLSPNPADLLIQKDTFFNATTGRLKLREFPDRTAELIPYSRENTAAAKRSEYMVVPIDDPKAVTEALRRTIGIRGVVKKQRRLWMVDQTRIHFDDVENLGSFIELEVVLSERQSDADGQAIAKDIMARLDIRDEDLVECAYIDLIESNDRNV